MEGRTTDEHWLDGVIGCATECPPPQSLAVGTSASATVRLSHEGPTLLLQPLRWQALDGCYQSPNRTTAGFQKSARVRSILGLTSNTLRFGCKDLDQKSYSVHLTVARQLTYRW